LPQLRQRRLRTVWSGWALFTPSTVLLSFPHLGHFTGSLSCMCTPPR